MQIALIQNVNRPREVNLEWEIKRVATRDNGPERRRGRVIVLTTFARGAAGSSLSGPPGGGTRYGGAFRSRFARRSPARRRPRKARRIRRVTKASLDDFYRENRRSRSVRVVNDDETSEHDLVEYNEEGLGRSQP